MNDELVGQTVRIREDAYPEMVPWHPVFTDALGSQVVVTQVHRDVLYVEHETHGQLAVLVDEVDVELVD